MNKALGPEYFKDFLSLLTASFLLLLVPDFIQNHL